MSARMRATDVVARLGGYEEVLSAADSAMYEAKRAGRDTVRVAGTATAASPSR